MRVPTRRGRDAVRICADAFRWDRALLATLRHASLPFGESLAATPLAELRETGPRDRLSLLAQFAAHAALLQFAGIADGELDPAEWAVVQKRGSDVRLVRVAARACDVSSAPPALTLAQQFAELVGAELDILQQSWARADAIYTEAFARLTGDVAADLRWARRAACGAIAAPGPEGLRMLASDGGRFGYSDDACIAAVERFAELDGSLRVVVLRGASPLERYSAFGALVSDRTLDPAAAAERVLAKTAHARHLFVVAEREAFDAASAEVVELLAHARHGTWLLPSDENRLPDAQPFIVAPRLASAAQLRASLDPGALEAFVDSGAFAAYLAHGDVPPPATSLPALAEPARSFIGALALLGTRIPRKLASDFLGDFLFRGALEELVVDGVTSLDGETFVFVSDAAREEAARRIATASRPAICRVAASHADGVRAALLWLDAGEPARATEALERTAWSDANETVQALRRVPRAILTPELATRYAHALVDCGRYRDARDVAPGEADFVLARAERHTGDYATALARLERIEARSFDAELLRAELLRLTNRESDAQRLLDALQPANDEERTRLDYERALHGVDVVLPETYYLAARLDTYRALERGDYDRAARSARESHARARTMTERVDASLDRVFAAFSAGSWDLARAIAVEALQEVEETQGDRAAGGILFTLAYLAADEGQWAHASQRIARLRRYYAGTNDAIRLGEIDLLTAHLDFSRGRFADARRAAEAVYAARDAHDQIREAAALILDELDWMEGARSTLRSNGRSGNAELTRRHERIQRHDATSTSDGVPGALQRFRLAVATRDDAAARALAAEYALVFDAAPAPVESELRILRLAATREFPFAPHDFDLAWCFATRNRLGQWNAIGSQTFDAATFDAILASGANDWIACSERELLFLDGCARWSTDGRDAVAALFRTRADNQRLRRVLEQEEAAAKPARADMVDGIVGQSPLMRDIYALIARVARRDVPVCILGESGTGKELAARAIHRNSTRRTKTFTAVNCAALPENLIESELFGHVRGAFTGADRDRAGLIETTDGGTLFLDEIGELPLAAQAKLLRFLQEGEFRRVGDTVNRSADVRIVSATNRKLEAAVEEGRFRDDLYYRIRGVELALPPLRERGTDVLLLAAHFLASEREKHRGGPALLAPDVEAIFTAYAWPGNVRELQNAIRAAHAMAGDAKQIDVEHLPERLRNVAPARVAAGSYQDAVARFKRDLIERSLLEARGNQNRAASLLKMSRQALAYQIRELGILVRA
ncbi:MAG: sigma 54-interacting transcriptional regulator [Acidobacteria bacterium]|nr:sigma 54-interacting transcriptional regulator [Acidobacteriota bacterium]MBV9477443.1 sigma 54-interacting transcriptional regulator [Acidobacteriota bacterium]